MPDIETRMRARRMLPLPVTPEKRRSPAPLAVCARRLVFSYSVASCVMASVTVCGVLGTGVNVVPSFVGMTSTGGVVVAEGAAVVVVGAAVVAAAVVVLDEVDDADPSSAVVVIPESPPDSDSDQQGRGGGC